MLRTVIEASASESGMGHLAFIMSTMADELAQELEELDEFQVRAYMYNIGEVIAWIGHGDNSRLPEMVREFAEQIVPTVNNDNDSRTAEQGSHLAIDSATR
jgi:hypothetical protein